MPAVSYEKKEHIAILSWREPSPGQTGMETEDFWAAIRDAVSAVEKDQDIYVAVFDGTGEQFLPGKNAGEQLPEDLKTRIGGLRVPVLAAVDGAVTDSGYTLLTACDICVMSENSSFPGENGRVSAEEACAGGLVNQVTVSGEQTAAALALAEQIVPNAQIAVQQTKRCVNIGLEAGEKAGLEFEQQAFALCHATEDKRIGMQALLHHESGKRFLYR